MWRKKIEVSPKYLVMDLDGVLTDGKFVYSERGKEFKSFSVDDHDAIKLLLNYMEVHVISADLRGFEISRRRISGDMGLSFSHVPTEQRLDWIASNFGLERTIYMADGIFDSAIFREVFYAIAPSSALKEVKKAADFVTECRGGERAVAEACLHIAGKFFGFKL